MLKKGSPKISVGTFSDSTLPDVSQDRHVLLSDRSSVGGVIMRQSRLFRVNKAFKPLPVEEGEEFFCNEIFEFNITELSAFFDANRDCFIQ